MYDTLSTIFSVLLWIYLGYGYLKVILEFNTEDQTTFAFSLIFVSAKSLGLVIVFLIILSFFKHTDNLYTLSNVITALICGIAIGAIIFGKVMYNFARDKFKQNS